MNEAREVMVLEEVAELLRLSTATVRRRVRDNVIPATRSDPSGRGRLLFRRADVMRFLEPRAAQP